MKWIPVTQRLPRYYGVVYVTIVENGKRVVDNSYFDAERKIFVKDTYSDYKDGEVLAWMPFYKPNPWKGDAE